MIKINSRIATVLYIVIMGGFALVGSYFSIKWDMNNDAIQCESENAEKSAFLVLNELNSNTGEFKALFMVSDFAAGKDKLTVYSVTRGLDPTIPDYDYRTLLSLQPGQNLTTSEAWNELRIPYDSRSYFYPLESYVGNIRIDFRKGGGEKTPLKLQVVNHIGELVHYPCANHYSFSQSSASNTFSFEMKRHRFVKLTAGILYLVAFFFLLHIARRGDTDKVLTNSLGYIAALWGIRQIIIGNTKIFPTLVDIITLALYLIIVGIVLFKILIEPRLATVLEEPDTTDERHSDQ